MNLIKCHESISSPGTEQKATWKTDIWELVVPVVVLFHSGRLVSRMWYLICIQKFFEIFEFLGILQMLVIYQLSHRVVYEGFYHWFFIKTEWKIKLDNCLFIWRDFFFFKCCVSSNVGLSRKILIWNRLLNKGLI